MLVQGISMVELRDEDVLAVLRTLEYDGSVECGRGAGEDDDDVFRERRLALPETAAPTSFPCGVCKARAPAARMPPGAWYGRLAWSSSALQPATDMGHALCWLTVHVT